MYNASLYHYVICKHIYMHLHRKSLHPLCLWSSCGPGRDFFTSHVYLCKSMIFSYHIFPDSSSYSSWAIHVSTCIFRSCLLLWFQILFLFVWSLMFWLVIIQKSSSHRADPFHLVAVFFFSTNILCFSSWLLIPASVIIFRSLIYCLLQLFPLLYTLNTVFVIPV